MRSHILCDFLKTKNKKFEKVTVNCIISLLSKNCLKKIGLRLG
jgi:hypothetical protein